MFDFDFDSQIWLYFLSHHETPWLPWWWWPIFPSGCWFSTCLSWIRMGGFSLVNFQSPNPQAPLWHLPLHLLKTPPVIFYNHWSFFLVFLKSLSRRLGWYAFPWAWDLAWWNFGGAMRGDDSWDACAVWKPQLFEGLPGKIFVFRTQGTSTVASELSWQLPSVLNLGGFAANSARHYAICSGWKIEMLFFPRIM